MNKVLTIAVAAYNVEPYIRQNIESVLSSEETESIELMIVDDGGKDGSLQIAKEYELKHPEIIKAIHKENGGYGSVHNYCIANASGKYYKIVDGDDWVDTEGLTKLVKYLRNSDVDAVGNDYYKGPNQDSLSQKSYKKKHDVPDRICNPNDLKFPFGMWALTYKTSVLRESKLKLPEHIFYTDRLYSTIPFSYVNSIIYLDFTVYCYRTGREGQSISVESRVKNIDKYLEITEMVCRHYAEDQREHKEYVLKKAANAYKGSIRALLLLPASAENMNKLRQYESRIRKMVPDIYKKSASLKTKMGWVITFLRMTGYKGYWVLSRLPKKLISY